MAENTGLTTKTQGQNTPETTRGDYYFTPRVDIYETETELTLFADIPGVKPEDVDLRYEKGELLLHAQVKTQLPAHYVANEYGLGDFYRVFHIHESIDAGKISAECKNGVLTVHLPKVEAVQPKQIKVTGE